MIIKHLSSSQGPSHLLRVRSTLGLGIFCLGLVGILCTFTILRGGVLPDFVHGFYSGVSTGLTVLGALFFARSRWLLRHPDKAKAVFVKAQDERERCIEEKAMSTTWMILFFLLAAALLITAPIQLTVFCTLLAVFFLSVVLLFLSRAVYAHKL